MNEKFKILIADDDEMFVKLISSQFAEKNCEVFCAVNGQEVVEKAKTLKPDLILIDMIMPVKNGFEAIQDIRDMDELKTVKIVVFSNLGQEQDKEKALKLGANNYLIKKDYSLSDLADKVLENLS